MFTSLMEKAGLILPREKGQGYYDRFRNRIMFPILDTQAHYRAFGGRALRGRGLHLDAVGMTGHGNVMARGFINDGCKLRITVNLLERIGAAGSGRQAARGVYSSRQSAGARRACRSGFFRTG